MSDGGAGRRLPEALLEEIFQQAVVEDLTDFTVHRPVDGRDPQLVLIVAPAGAATGGLHEDLAAELGDFGGIVPVVSDELRIYHPDYFRLVVEHPEAVIEHTDQAARWWQDRAVEHLAVRGYNIAFEDHFSTPDRLLDTAMTFAGVGYQVRVAATAVPAVLSRFGIIEMYARVAEATGTGAWVSAEDHDVSYDEVTEILYRAEVGDTVSGITLRDHTGVIYDRWRDPSGSWPSGTVSAVDALAKARTDPLATPQRVALANRFAGTIERLAEAGLAQRSLYETAGQVAQDLAGYPSALDARTAARLNSAMLALLDADTDAAEHPLDTALVDLEVLNEELDSRPRWPPMPDAGAEPPFPEPPEPDLGFQP